jgi:ribosomal protein S18 acetylase RimI-like enzyme
MDWVRLRFCLSGIDATGAMLLNHVIEQAKDDKLHYVFLHVKTNNQEAKTFYEKRGFKLVERVDEYYARNVDVKSAWLLRLDLQQ